MDSKDSILIIDFGSQVTQLIARRLREAGVYTEIMPCTGDPEHITAAAPRGIILSGGPNSVAIADTPRAPQVVFEMGVPVLGICYGQQTMCQQLGGRVEPGTRREFGRAALEVVEDLKNRYIDISEYKRHCIGNYLLEDSSVEKEVLNSMEKLEPCFDVARNS